MNKMFTSITIILSIHVRKSIFCAAILFFSGIQGLVQAQQASVGCGSPTSWIAPTFSGLTIPVSSFTGAAGSGWINTALIIDADASNSGTLTLASSRIGSGILDCITPVLTPGAATLRVTDASNTYSRGNYVGFVTSNPANVTSITISIMNGGTVLESSASPVVTDLGGGLFQVGFVTTGAGTFNGVQLDATLDAPGACPSTTTATLEVYYPFQKKYCALQSCNINENASIPNFNVSVSSGGLLVGNPGNVITPSTTDAGTFNTLVAGLGPRYISVTDNITTHPAGTFAGFEIESSSLVGISALTNYTIELRNGATVVDQATGSGLVLGGSLLSSTGRNMIGIVATGNFNEVRIIERGLSLGIAATNVYNAVFKRFCEGAALTCNTPVSLTSPAYPVTVNGTNSGLLGVGASISNIGFLIDNIPGNSATISLPAGVGASASLSVKKELTDFPAGTYAGFDIEKPGLIGVNIAGDITISTYKDGNTTPEESFSSTQLLAIVSPLLTGTSRQRLGFITTRDFDEIQITVANTGLDLSTTQVYAAVVQTFCSGPGGPGGPAVTCNTPVIHEAGLYPVVINGLRTGITSPACVGCSISNTEAIIDNNPSTSASVVLAAGLIGGASVSVVNAIDDYPAGTYAGFDIGTPSLVGVDLFGDFTLSIYRDGVLKQQKTVPSELISATSSILTGTGRQLLGLVADSSFDEIQLTISKTLAVSLGTINIYSAIIQHNCSAPPDCSAAHLLTTPAFPVAVESPHTGVDNLLCVACTVLNPNNVVSADLTDYALIEVVAGAVGAASIAVKNGADDYPAGTYAGFTIEDDNTVLQGDLLQSITINTYKDGQPVESISGTNLLNFDFIFPIFGTGGGIFNIGIVTTQEFDEVQLSISSLVGGLNQIRVYSAFVDIRGTGTGICPRLLINPDFNVGFPGVTITGNLQTNDIIPVGTPATYGTPVADGSNPTTTVPVVNPDGSYSFSETTPGVYTFEVPVCIGSVVPCSMSELTITITDPGATTVPPIVNPDILVVVGETTSPSSTTLNILANDASPLGSSLGTPGIVSGPAHGTASIDGSNNLVYTPEAGFVGTDTIIYQVCEQPANTNCGTAKVFITVLTPGSTAVPVASDDFGITPQGTNLSGNVSSNDINPGTVNFPVAVIAGKGSKVSDATGNYTFTPEAAYSGQVSYVYSSCTGGDCSSATLYMLVWPAVPTPVKLTDFTAVKSGSKVLLSWKTVMEENFSHFVVERAVPGGAYTEIREVKANGSGSDYSITDNEPPAGLVYYRLKMVDIDGAVEYSPVRFVDIQSQVSLRIFPNPVITGELYLSSGNYSGNISIVLTDVSGRMLKARTAAVSPGRVVPVSVDGLSNQLIFVTVLNEKRERILQQKVLIKR